MSLAKHTPAPWYISTPGRTDALYVGPVVVSSHRTALGGSCSFPDLLNHIDDHELYANAQLISAAPELLAALKEIVSQVEGFQDCNGDKGFVLSDALAAIAKAGGAA